MAMASRTWQLLTMRPSKAGLPTTFISIYCAVYEAEMLQVPGLIKCLSNCRASQSIQVGCWSSFCGLARRSTAIFSRGGHLIGLHFTARRCVAESLRIALPLSYFQWLFLLDNVVIGPNHCLTRCISLICIQTARCWLGQLSVVRESGLTYATFGPDFHPQLLRCAHLVPGSECPNSIMYRVQSQHNGSPAAGLEATVLTVLASMVFNHLGRAYT